MHIRVNREMLIAALTKVIGVVERRQTLPILGNLLFTAQEDVLTVSGTDLEVEISTSTAAEVPTNGEVTLPARKVVDIARALPENIEISMRAENDKALVVSGRSRFTLSTLPARDFPTIDHRSEFQSLEVVQRTLKYVLEKTAFAMGHQDVRYYLNGLLLIVKKDRVVAVATDGHRLAKIEMDLPVNGIGEGEMILPRKSVIELNRLLGNGEEKAVHLEFSEKLFRARIDETILTTKLIDGKYPDYERVVPPVPERVVFADKETLRQALLRTVILSNEKFRGVRLNLGEGQLKLQAQNLEREEAEEELEVEYAQEPTIIGFNAQYLLDVLNVLEGEVVEIGFKDGDSSAILRNRGNEKETFVVMPMRL